jgi:hypothetical protein
MKLEHIHKSCSTAPEVLRTAVFSVFGFVSAQLQGVLQPAPSPKPRQKPKILAAHRYIFSVNAPARHIPSERRQAGILLMECLVYLAVFTILLGIGTATFYFCWDHTKAVFYATDDIETALRVCERWRRDVRSATGAISVETAGDGETVKIPEAGKEVLYRFQNGEVRRQLAAAEFSELLLPKVKSSAVKAETRGQINAWRWELELPSRRKETHMPLLFTFEAVQAQP